MTLEQLLVYAVDGGLGWLAYWLLENLPGVRERYAAIQAADAKRWIAAGLTALFALCAWGLGVGLGFFELPAGAGWRSWAVMIGDILVGVGTTFASSQLAHTKTLKARRVG
jgi:hypothetical protein